LVLLNNKLAYQKKTFLIRRVKAMQINNSTYKLPSVNSEKKSTKIRNKKGLTFKKILSALIILIILGLIVASIIFSANIALIAGSGFAASIGGLIFSLIVTAALSILLGVLVYKLLGNVATAVLSVLGLIFTASAILGFTLFNVAAADGAAAIPIAIVKGLTESITLGIGSTFSLLGVLLAGLIILTILAGLSFAIYKATKMKKGLAKDLSILWLSIATLSVVGLTVTGIAGFTLTSIAAGGPLGVITASFSAVTATLTATATIAGATISVGLLAGIILGAIAVLGFIILRFIIPKVNKRKEKKKIASALVSNSNIKKINYLDSNNMNNNNLSEFDNISTIVKNFKIVSDLYCDVTYSSNDSNNTIHYKNANGNKIMDKRLLNAHKAIENIKKSYGQFTKIENVTIRYELAKYTDSKTHNNTDGVILNIIKDNEVVKNDHGNGLHNALTEIAATFNCQKMDSSSCIKKDDESSIFISHKAIETINNKITDDKSDNDKNDNDKNVSPQK